MFVQTIEGRTSDPAGVKRQLERWKAELMRDAPGYLGSTAGVTADGTAFVMARFESEADAKANAARPEQSAWWEETAKHFDGDPTFHDSSDVEELMGGGSDDAGFVQVMIGRVTDRSRLREVDASMAEVLPRHRPDLIGAIRAWQPDGTAVEVAYFTSEAEARAGEGRERPDDVAAAFAEFQSLVPDMRFLDLGEPILVSP
ncbi:MAG: hypothetical protein M5U14_21615 [Acidimicrobiia bacterium]|nr:hypothetical protein [Acidimicrobiia bacterium]